MVKVIVAESVPDESLPGSCCCGFFDLVLGAAAIAGGVLAIVWEFENYKIAAGIWSGFLFFLTGIAGCCSCRNAPGRTFSIVSFLSLSCISLCAACCLLGVTVDGYFKDCYHKGINVNSIGNKSHDEQKKFGVYVGLMIVASLEAVLSMTAAIRSCRRLCRYA